MHSTPKFGSAFIAIVAATVVACGATDQTGSSSAALGGATDLRASSSARLGRGAPAYLALGDSVTFGFTPLRVPPKPPAFFVGFPQFLAEIVDTPVVNAACPGQTSSSFLDLGGTDNGCFPFRSQFDLHVEYDGTQAAFAEQFLMTHPRTWLVTLQLGANDLFLLQAQCQGKPPDCALTMLPQVLEQLGSNLATAFADLRGTGYEGQIISVNYYSPSTDLTSRAAVQAMNVVIAQTAAAFGSKTADVFSAFDAASGPPTFDACAAGLLIPLPGGGCDVHPSQAGAELIAETIAPLVVPRTK
jgi:lysophospholipase L1-like esterase